MDCIFLIQQLYGRQRSSALYEYWLGHLIQLVLSFSIFFFSSYLCYPGKTAIQEHTAAVQSKSDRRISLGREISRNMLKNRKLVLEFVLNVSFKSLLRQQLLVVVVVSGAFFSALHVWKNMIFLLCIEVLLHYICIQKLKPVPKAAIHLANTAFCQNLQCCSCFGSQGDLQREFKALVLTQAADGPRARLLVLFAILWQLKSGETTKLASI